MGNQPQPQDVSEKLLRLAVQASPSGVLIVDRAGRIVYANPALLEMFGYRGDELAGQAIEVLVPEKDAEAHRRHREKFDARPSPRAMGRQQSFDAIRKDGCVFPVEIGLRPGEIEDGRMVVATVINITERRRIEDRLHRHEQHLEELVEERTRELREAQIETERVMEKLIQSEKLAAIGTLVSGIGHEINNPLYLILGMGEAIRDEDDHARCREYGAEIVGQCSRIAEIVRNLSQYARPGASHELLPVDLNEAASAAILAAKRSLSSDRVEIRQHESPVPPILAKAEEIQQVLFNIIRNGIQACGDQGTIEIETARQDDQVAVRIRDSGGGIRTTDVKKIFDPFFTTKGPDEGEGLGLYIVQQIVTRHNGSIDVVNDGGAGTTFVVQFPVADKN